jgi:HK97 family phage major capsid protein
MALTTSSTLASNILAESIERKIRDYLYAHLQLPQFITVKDLAGLNTKTWSTPQWPSLSAAAVAEATDLTNTTVTTTDDTITVSEVGIMLEISKLGKRTSGIDENALAIQGAGAVKRKIEEDIAALFSGFSQRSGTTGTDTTLDELVDAIRLLDTGNAGGGYVMVLHPRQVSTLRKLIAGTSGSTATFYSTGVVDPSLKQAPGYVMDFLGVPVYQSTYVPEVNTATDYCGAIFNMKALGMAVLWDVEVEFEANASARSTEVVVTACYGVGELDDSCGVGILSVKA